MKWLKDKILPGLIMLIISVGFTYLEKQSIEKSEKNKTTDDRQDEVLQDQINKNSQQDSLLTLLIQKELK